MISWVVFDLAQSRKAAKEDLKRGIRVFFLILLCVFAALREMTFH
jgi:hypothetical protein